MQGLIAALHSLTTVHVAVLGDLQWPNISGGTAAHSWLLRICPNQIILSFLFWKQKQAEDWRKIIHFFYLLAAEPAKSY